MKRNNLDYIINNAELARILLEKSYKEGNFTLASGRKSTYYFDCRVTSLSAEGSLLIGKIFYDLIEDMMVNDYLPNVKGVAGMTMGGDPLVTAVTTVSALPESEYFFDGLLIRKQPKDHGTNNQIEGMANFKEGDYVFMLEDVITTGGSILKACKVIEDAGLKVAGVGVIMDREEGGAEAIREAGYKLFPIYTPKTLKQFATMHFERIKDAQ